MQGRGSRGLSIPCGKYSAWAGRLICCHACLRADRHALGIIIQRGRRTKICHQSEGLGREPRVQAVAATARRKATPCLSLAHAVLFSWVGRATMPAHGKVVVLVLLFYVCN